MERSENKAMPHLTSVIVEPARTAIFTEEFARWFGIETNEAAIRIETLASMNSSCPASLFVYTDTTGGGDIVVADFAVIVVFRSRYKTNCVAVST